MNPIASVALASWSPPGEVILAATVAVLPYLRGFAVVHRQLPERFPSWRRTSFLAGIAALLIALASPLDVFAELLLQVHMVQHWLLMMVAPPLLWLGAPLVPWMRGLPRDWLRRGLGPFLAWHALRRALDVLVRPGVALPLWIVVTLAWHWPGAYDLALRSRGWHDLEHASFLLVGLLFWFGVVAPWPAKPPVGRAGVAVFLGVAALFNTVFSAVFVFSGRAFYPVYAEVPRLFGIDAVTDQNLAGAFLWVAGALPMAVSAAIAAMRAADSDSLVRRPPPRRELPPRRRRPRLAPALASRRLRRALQICMALLAVAIVVDGWLGPQIPSATNLAGVLPWTYWRGFVVIGLLLAGNLFCAVCPFTLSRPLSRRLGLALRRPLGARLRWPGRLANRWLAVALLAAYLWAYEVFALWDSPWWTAWLVVGYFAGSFAVEAVFGRGSFCKRVCPIGQFHFAASGISPLEVRAQDPQRCASCTTHDCLRGGPRGPGCPTSLFLPVKQGNLDCTFCLDCVRACPNDNAGLQVVTPGRAIGRARGPRLDFAALALVFCFGAFANAAAMVSPVAGLPHLPLWLAAALVPAPVVLALACARIGRAAAGRARSTRHLLSALAPALIPLGFAMWLAHFGFHAGTGLASALPALARAAGDLGLPPAGPTRALGLSAGDLTGLEIAALGVGLVVSVAVTWRLARGLDGSARVALGIAAPWMLLSLLLYGAGVWIFLQPMQMRGMSM